MKNLVPTRGRFGVADEFDSLISNFFNVPSVGNGDNCYIPAVDVCESKDDIKLIFEMPGMNKEEIKVWVEDGVLTVSGERKEKTEEKDENYIRSEIRTGSFTRSFRLPKYADASKISADYNNGLLTVKIARAEEAKPKEIKVKVS